LADFTLEEGKHMNETILHSHHGIGEPQPKMVRVWDPLVRLFHWSLAGAFTIAFVSEDDLLAVHVWAGYLILGLILIRVLWGFVGPRHARWSDFVKEPTEIFTYLKAALRSRAARYLGHNPAGGAMVVALMLSLSVTSLTGLAVYGAEELSGPMAPLLSGLSEGWAHALEDIHELMANLTLILVLVHLAGVAIASLEHRENLVRAMITGLKRSGTE
jgi:cytochrome b